ncbi:MAG: hypothetical protein MJ246_02230 [Clostridia bacterium]|nr:hypothetical protein [Clostridia bacterium]
MFSRSKIECLDLRYFVLKNKAKVDFMFYGTNLKYIDISNMDFSISTIDSTYIDPDTQKKTTGNPFKNATVGVMKAPAGTKSTVQLKDANYYLVGYHYNGLQHFVCRTSTTASKNVSAKVMNSKSHSKSNIYYNHE